jgi:hypothetical protein
VFVVLNQGGEAMKRREFLKMSGFATIGVATAGIGGAVAAIVFGTVIVAVVSSCGVVEKKTSVTAGDTVANTLLRCGFARIAIPDGFGYTTSGQSVAGYVLSYVDSRQPDMLIRLNGMEYNSAVGDYVARRGDKITVEYV